jgi:transcriptional regulator with XRE-family HTH domain
MLRGLKAPYGSTRPETIERREQAAERIRDLRLHRDLTQQRLGERYGVDRRTIADLESGRVGITIDALYDVAYALGVPVIRLLADGRSHERESATGSGGEGGESSDSAP